MKVKNEWQKKRRGRVNNPDQILLVNFIFLHSNTGRICIFWVTRLHMVTVLLPKMSAGSWQSNLVCVKAKAANLVWPLTIWKATSFQNHKISTNFGATVLAATQNARIISCICMSCACHAPEGSSQYTRLPRQPSRREKFKLTSALTEAPLV